MQKISVIAMFARDHLSNDCVVRSPSRRPCRYRDIPFQYGSVHGLWLAVSHAGLRLEARGDETPCFLGSVRDCL
jgi:hypothetical protein